MEKFNFFCRFNDKDGKFVFLVLCMLIIMLEEDLICIEDEGYVFVYIIFSIDYVFVGFFCRIFVFFGKWVVLKISCD